MGGVDMVVRLETRGDAIAWDTPVPFLQRNANFEPSDVRTHAMVRANAESDMPIGPAIQGHTINVGHQCRIVVGRYEADNRAVAGPNRAAVEIGVLNHGTAIDCRRQRPQQLFGG